MEYYNYFYVFIVALPLLIIFWATGRARMADKIPLTESQVRVVYWVPLKRQILKPGVIEVKNGFIVLYDLNLAEVDRMPVSEASVEFLVVTRGQPWIVKSKVSDQQWTIGMSGVYSWRFEKGAQERDKFAELLTASGVEIKGYDAPSVKAKERKSWVFTGILLALVAMLIIYRIISSFLGAS